MAAAAAKQAAEGPAIGGAAAAPTGPANLAWDDNAAWLAACKSSGVASWYDSGLRLTAPVEPETRAVGVVVAETAAWVAAAAAKQAAEGPAIGGAAAAPTGPANLAWDDNAAWAAACKSSGVASWFDSGLRLTAPVEPESRAVGVIVAETAAWVAAATVKQAAEGPAIGGAAAAPTGPANLAWDDNAAWAAACKSRGVASWYDSGLRLTEPTTKPNFIEKIIEDRKLYSPATPVRAKNAKGASAEQVAAMQEQLDALQVELEKERAARK